MEFFSKNWNSLILSITYKSFYDISPCKLLPSFKSGKDFPANKFKMPASSALQRLHKPIWVENLPNSALKFGCPGFDILTLFIRLRNGDVNFSYF